MAQFGCDWLWLSQQKFEEHIGIKGLEVYLFFRFPDITLFKEALWNVNTRLLIFLLTTVFWIKNTCK